MRQAFLSSYDERREILERIADGQEREVVATEAGPVIVPPALNTRIRAVEALGKGAGIGTVTEKVKTDKRVFEIRVRRE